MISDQKKVQTYNIQSLKKYEQRLSKGLQIKNIWKKLAFDKLLS